MQFEVPGSRVSCPTCLMLCCAVSPWAPTAPPWLGADADDAACSTLPSSSSPFYLRLLPTHQRTPSWSTVRPGGSPATADLATRCTDLTLAKLKPTGFNVLLNQRCARDAIMYWICMVLCNLPILSSSRWGAWVASQGASSVSSLSSVLRSDHGLGQQCILLAHRHTPQ